MTSKLPSLRRHGARRAGTLCPQLETLESRIALTASATVGTALDIVEPLQMQMSENSGSMSHELVTITDTQVRTTHDVFPRFAANPTIAAIRGGDWNDPNVWSAGRVPIAGDRIVIGAGMTVAYATQSNAKLDSLEISGSLIFDATVNTRIVVANVMVMPGGLLQIGSEAMPIRADRTAELIIADKPIDLAMDPTLVGTGLISFGAVKIHGTPIAHTWQEFAVEPRAGSQVIYMPEPVTDWKPGDMLVIPDTRQVSALDSYYFVNGEAPAQWEEVYIYRIDGNAITLRSPLRFDHLGARNVNGERETMPQVALLTRNVTVRSESPSGTRGHTLFTARADVDIRYARFLDLGRTDALRPLDNTKFDAQGNVTHYGTNQIARYAVHFHHLLGPMNPANSGYQFEFIGNSVQNSLKWAVDVHATSFGLLKDNVVYRGQGAGIVTEAGSEIGNVFRDNIVIGMRGTREDGKTGTDIGDYGRGGSGFWFRRGGNFIIGNVAANNAFAGFVFDGYNLDPPRLPLFRGANTHDMAQSIAGDLTPGTLFLNNQAYGFTLYGLWAAYISGANRLDNQPTTLINNFRVWNVQTAVKAYHTSSMVIAGSVFLSDLKAQDRNDAGAIGMDFRTYENFKLQIRNVRIEGMYQGIIAPIADSSEAGIDRPTVISDSVLKNFYNIVVRPGPDNLFPSSGNVLEVRNVKFQLLTDLPKGPYTDKPTRPPANISMQVQGENIDYTHVSIVRVYDYNQIPGNDFQVFYREQAPDYVLLNTDPKLLSIRDSGVVGSPQARLTNAQNWAKYGIAMAGAVAPTNAIANYPGIDGLVAPIQAAPSVPRVVLVTPWNDAVVTSSFVRVRYNVIGQLPPGAQLYVQFDGVTQSSKADGGFFNVKPGVHTVSVFIGDSSGRRLRSTTMATSTFRVNY